MRAHAASNIDLGHERAPVEIPAEAGTTNVCWANSGMLVVPPSGGSGCYRNGRQGAALILVSLSMVAAGMVGTAMLVGIVGGRMQRMQYDTGTRAMYAAESGRAYVVSQVRQDSAFRPDETYTLASGDRFLVSSSVESNELEVVVTGLSYPETHREAAYELAFSIPLQPDGGGGGGGDGWTQPPGTEGSAWNEVFVFGGAVQFAGGQLEGPGGVMVVQGDFSSRDVNGGATLGVSTLYVDGDVDFSTGSADLGSSAEPGQIFVNGDLTLAGGSRDIWGDVYVKGDLTLSNARIHGNIYVDGDVTLGWGAPVLDAGKMIYYTGQLSIPRNYPQAVIDRTVWQESVPDFAMPPRDILALRPEAWYVDAGYSDTSELENDSLVFVAGDYAFNQSGSPKSLEDIVIVSGGDLSVELKGNAGMKGVLIAPFGKITFTGGSFEGLALAGEVVDFTKGGASVRFVDINELFPDADTIPFVVESGE